MFKVLTFLVLFSASAVAWLAVPEPTASSTYLVTGQVVLLAEGPSHDLRIRLESDDKFYYVNRGLETLSLEDIQVAALGKTVTLKAHKLRWSPFNPGNRVAPVAAIVVDGQPTYSAF